MQDQAKMIQVLPKSGPQEIADWCAETETFQLALQAKYVEIVNVGDQADEVSKLSRRLAPKHVAPLAAETRPLKSLGHVSGLEKLASF